MANRTEPDAGTCIHCGAEPTNHRPEQAIARSSSERTADLIARLLFARALLRLLEGESDQPGR